MRMALLEVSIWKEVGEEANGSVGSLAALGRKLGEVRKHCWRRRKKKEEEKKDG